MIINFVFVNTGYSGGCSFYKLLKRCLQCLVLSDLFKRVGWGEEKIKLVKPVWLSLQVSEMVRNPALTEKQAIATHYCLSFLPLCKHSWVFYRNSWKLSLTIASLSSSFSNTFFFQTLCPRLLSVPRILTHSKAAQLQLCWHQLLLHKGLDYSTLRGIQSSTMLYTLDALQLLLCEHIDCEQSQNHILGSTKLPLMPSG